MFTKTKRIIALSLAALMTLSLTACGKKEEEPTWLINDTVEITSENSITYLSMYLDGDRNVTINAKKDDDGTIIIEYYGDEDKVGAVDESVWAKLTEEIMKTDLATLHRANEDTEGDDCARMHIELKDGTMLTAEFDGEIPEAYINGFNAMEDVFKEITSAMPVYVQEINVVGDVDESIKGAVCDILSALGGLNGYKIVGPNEEKGLAELVGLPNVNNITVGAKASLAVEVIPYYLSVVVAKDASNVNDICADFETGINWGTWEDNIPEGAAIATKDNMVFCLIGSQDSYKFAINKAVELGWNVVKEIPNPNAGTN